MSTPIIATRKPGKKVAIALSALNFLQKHNFVPNAPVSNKHFVELTFKTDMGLDGYIRVYFPHAIHFHYDCADGTTIDKKFGSEDDLLAALATFVIYDFNALNNIPTIAGVYPQRDPKTTPAAPTVQTPTKTPKAPKKAAKTPQNLIALAKAGKKIPNTVPTPTAQAAPTPNPTPFITVTLPADVAQNLVNLLAAQGITVDAS